MIYSMTGYGKSEQKNNQIKVVAEIKSLNSKGMEINLKAPYYLKSIDLDIRNLIQEKLQRGKIDVFINIEWSEDILDQMYNVDEIKKHYFILKSLMNEIGENSVNPYIEATLFREALNQSANKNNYEETLLNDENKQLIFLSVTNAVQMLDNFRKTEGEKLAKDILNQIQIIQNTKKKIEEIEPERKTKIKEKILTKLKENLDVSKINYDRLEQELIYYIEKIDINEELVRLNSHIEYFMNLMKNAYGMGKKLSFITQEIGREINTIGSKANDENIQKLVVEMKDALEKIKEQLNNVL